MKFLITGDWHLTTKSPENRTDDYWKTVQKKVNNIFDIAIEEDVYAILQPGDMFDTATVSYKVTGFLGSLVSEFSLYHGGSLISVPGQHDLRFHNLQNENTPFHMLKNSNLIHTPTSSITPEESDKIVSIYGAGWGEDIPKISDVNHFNILLTHRMIIRDRKSKLWESQEDFSLATKLLRESGFDLIVSGDNHQSFFYQTKNRFLFNCGSLLRSTVSQVHHEPVVYIFNTENLIKFKEVKLNVEPFDHVMDLEKKERNERRDEKLNTFIEQLQSADAADINYKDNVWKLIKKTEKAGNPITKGTLKIIEQILG